MPISFASLQGLLYVQAPCSHACCQPWQQCYVDRSVKVLTPRIIDSGYGLTNASDTKTPISGKRLESFVSTSEPSWGLSKTQLTKFRHVTAPTLSHLLAILLHPPPGFFPDDLTLLVVNGANSLVDLDFPRYQLAGPTKSEQQKWQAGRRYAILGSLISAMNKLAMINNMAVVVSTGCSTRMRPDSGLGAALVPGVGGAEWDAGIWTRLVVFCDFNARFVGLQKAQGKNLVSREEVGEVGRIISFDLAKGGGLLEVTGEESVSAIPLPLMPSKPSPVKPRKRNFDEIADSEDEDVDEYGWLETDEDTIAAEGANDAPSNKDDETEPF